MLHFAPRPYHLGLATAWPKFRYTGRVASTARILPYACTTSSGLMQSPWPPATRGLRVVRLVDLQPATDDPLVQERDRLRRLLDDEMQAMPLDLGKPRLRWRPPKADECVDAHICEGGGAARLLQPHRDGKEAGVLRQTVGELARMRLHIVGRDRHGSGPGREHRRAGAERKQAQTPIPAPHFTLPVNRRKPRPGSRTVGRHELFGWPRVEP